MLNVVHPLQTPFKPTPGVVTSAPWQVTFDANEVPPGGAITIQAVVSSGAGLVPAPFHTSRLHLVLYLFGILVLVRA
jgi:hypothetical protein